MTCRRISASRSAVAHFTKIAPDFLKIPGFLHKQFICARDGKIAGGVYMWESQEAARRFYSGEWLAGIRARYGKEPKISYYETVALADKASGRAAAWNDRRRGPAMPNAI